jgi:hypothetical protein
MPTVTDPPTTPSLFAANGKGNDSSEDTCDNDSELGDDESGYRDHDENKTLVDINDTETLGEDLMPFDLPKNMYRLQKEHPFHETHVTVLKPLNQTSAVNFIGPILPRCDQGDREFYCLTMLALFKPWRTGLHLKMEKKSWDETFNEHDFTKRQTQLMRNFNIKYECYDARDDFHAQMKAGSTPHELPINYFDGNEADVDFDFEHDPYVDPSGEDLPDVQKLCTSEFNRRKEAGEIKDVLQRTGWLEEKLEVTSSINIIEVNPASHLPAATWKTMLQQKKQSFLDNKVQSTSKRNQAGVESLTPNVVKILTKLIYRKLSTQQSIMVPWILYVKSIVSMMNKTGLSGL